MKKSIGILLLVLIAIGCENSDKLTFEPLQIVGEDCATCPKIDIDVPKAIDDTAIANTINRSTEEEIISYLSFDEEEDIETLNDAIVSFTKSFEELATRFPEDTVGWEAKVDGEVVYEDQNILTLAMKTYIYTGGAHGYGATTFLNFDKIKGTELENWELFEDLEDFQKLAEAKFRAQESIPEKGNINVTGFMFEDDEFHLAENIGYTEDGIQFVYNQYEVASYADGPILLTLPFKEINKYLKNKVKS
ncbi:DUF3298 and DUF4163 domain-containing protein [Flagellimonas sp. HMM57]|uniref:DUF3298 and DUF4163 domain-containing protein n=1 Tax=unclassified Flagellimonas TaxID=2644544 RepID=UPI0013D1CD6C|nr:MULTISPECIES: DUF3298 and DUF4163 domain-containing protein [unclassified Flagellimonas]UII77905.1 DUF3298 and DUF4163 domain-containing protein [Flagellimonas sp. HMM57]